MPAIVERCTTARIYSGIITRGHVYACAALLCTVSSVHSILSGQKSDEVQSASMQHYLALWTMSSDVMLAECA